MSLATSCPACGTVFKVVEDQLKVSEGWVRCGHCHEVFNALEGLFDLEGRQRPTYGAAVDSPVKSRSPAKTASGAASPAPPRPGPRPAGPDEGRADWIETRPAMYSDIQALQKRQRERDTETQTRFARPGTPALAADNSAPSMSAEVPQTAAFGPTPEPEPIPAGEHPGPSEPVQESTDVSAQEDSTLFAPFERPSQSDMAPDVEPATSPEPSTQDSMTATAIAEPPHEVIDFSLADTVFLPHESSRLFDDLPTDTPLMPPMHEDGWPEPVDATPGEAQLPDPFASATAVAAAGMPAAAALPDFVRAADRAAWWRRPAVRSAVVALCLVFGALLAFQLALHQRDLLVARWPSLRSPALATCALLDCEVHAPRQLDALAVENSSLTRPTGVDGYRLQVLIRNRADYPVLAPHLELSLSDGAGAVIVRRILAPADFRQAEQLAASSEGNWQLELASSDKRIAGFTVAAFYP